MVSTPGLTSVRLASSKPVRFYITMYLKIGQNCLMLLMAATDPHVIKHTDNLYPGTRVQRRNTFHIGEKAAVRKLSASVTLIEIMRH